MLQLRLGVKRFFYTIEIVYNYTKKRSVVFSSVLIIPHVQLIQLSQPVKTMLGY